LDLNHPKNVLIQQFPTPGGPQTWWVKLADFGISKHFGSDANAANTTVLGTRDYMAPELQGALPLPPPPQSTLARIPSYPLSDMWSLGAMVFRMLTGAAAFPTSRQLVRFCDGEAALFPKPNSTTSISVRPGKPLSKHC